MSETADGAGRLAAFVQNRMDELGYTRQDQLIRPGMGKSTVSRILIQPGYVPSVDTIGILARVLKVAEGDLLAFVVHGDAKPVPTDLHPLAAELDEMLGDTSSLASANHQQEKRFTRQTSTGRWKSPSQDRLPSHHTPRL